ncbi:hypothetical protein BTR22_07105 [Alkalihalophilus pseudofirmus]|uniref:sensor histidine kinase n=1 Tax=Alkalihalophilus pseudofirmus TaxID=79885 RepID=UPI000951E3CA|nr:hypothetical protein BTR22_07105 [Alkalihalophilus pseudofirmus]
MKLRLKAFYNKVLTPIRNSITKKYVILFALTFIIPTLLIYQLIVTNAESMVEKDIIETNVRNTDNVVKRINKEISDTVIQLQLISGNIGDDGVDIDLIYQRAQIAISQSPLIHSIYLLNEDQRVIFEAPFVRDVQPVITYKHPKFEQIKWSNTYAVSDFTTNYRGEMGTSILIPVMSEEQEFNGALVAEVSQEYLTDILKNASPNRGHFSFLLDSQGTVIASADSYEVGQDYSDNTLYEKLILESYGVIKETYADEDSVIAFQSMRDGWGLGFGVPEVIAYEPIRKLSHLFTLSFLGIFVLSLLFIWSGMRNIVYPIVRLTSYAKKYLEKMYYEPEQNSHHYPNDEIGELRKTIISVGNSNYEKQKLLEEKERYLQDVIEGIPYGIITIDKSGIITYVNQQFEKMVGYTRDQMVSYPLSELPIKKDDNDYMLLQSLISEGGSSELESYIIDSDGQKHIVKIATAKFYNDKEESIGSIAVLQDISQMKLLESRLKQNDKLALIGQITTGIAHEIKNPLAILSGASELLVDEVEETACTDDVKQLSTDIHQVVQRMKGITNNFLNFAKINKKEASSVEIQTVITEVLHLVRFKTTEQNIDVVRQYHSNSKLLGAHDQLIQAFLNLVLNAIEAMPNGGTLTVSIKEEYVELDTKNVVVSLKDTGGGIPEKEMEWLFDPFFTTKEDGNGLGLTIARDIIREHQGVMHIENSGAGTCIECRFSC